MCLLFIVLSRPVVASFNIDIECGVMGESGVVVLSKCHLVLLPTFVAGNCCPDYYLVLGMSLAAIEDLRFKRHDEVKARGMMFEVNAR